MHIKQFAGGTIYGDLMPLTNEDQGIYCRTLRARLRWNAAEISDRRDARLMLSAAAKRCARIGYAAIRVGTHDAGGARRDAFDAPRTT